MNVYMHALPALPAPALRPRRLLIAEDDAQAMFPLREFFCEHGFTVDCVVGPVEAGRMLDRFSYDVVLTDLHLTRHRRAEGMVVLQLARRHQPEIRAVMMSAFLSPEIEYDARRFGADAVLSKPIGLQRLQEVVSGPGPRTSVPGCRTS